MSMAWPDDLIAEDWKREYEKIILSRKYAAASTLIGVCLANPEEQAVKAAFGAVVDFVTSIPIGEEEKKQEKRDGFLVSLDEIEVVLYGNPELENVRLLSKKYGVMSRPERSGVRKVSRIQNLPELVKQIRTILVQAGDFATSAGLRILLAKHRKFGMEKIMEEEGVKGLDV